MNQSLYENSLKVKIAKKREITAVIVFCVFSQHLRCCSIILCLDWWKVTATPIIAVFNLLWVLGIFILPMSEYVNIFYCFMKWILWWELWWLQLLGRELRIQTRRFEASFYWWKCLFCCGKMITSPKRLGVLLRWLLAKDLCPKRIMETAPLLFTPFASGKYDKTREKETNT